MICIITWRKLGLTRSSPGMLLIVIPGLQQILLKFLSDLLQKIFSDFFFFPLYFFSQIKTKLKSTFCSRFWTYISNSPPPPLHKHTRRRTPKSTIFVKWPRNKRYDSNSLYSVSSLQQFFFTKSEVPGQRALKKSQGAKL